MPLKSSEQLIEVNRLKLLESVVTNTTDAVLITEAKPFDLPGPIILYVNEAFTKMTGYTAEEVIGKSPRILQGPKTDKNELKRIGKSLRKWETCEATLINYKKCGEEFWINFSMTPVADENGIFTHWISIDKDITQNKVEELQKALLAETSLLFNQQLKLSLLLDKLVQKVVNYDHFAIAEIWLAGADRDKISLIAKESRTEKTNDLNKNSVHINSLNKGESLPGKVWEQGKILEWDNLKNDSDPRRDAALSAGVEVAYGIPLISENVIIGVLVIGLGEKRMETSRSLIPLFNLISTHFGAEIKRKQLELELHEVFSLAPDIICILGTEDRFLKKINPAMSCLSGYTEAELLSKPLDDFLHANDQSSIKKFFDGNKEGSFENRFITKAGETLWISWTAHLNEREGLLFCVGKDITNRKLSDALLIASEKKYSQLFHLSPLPKFVFDLKTSRILNVNDAAVKQYGYTKKMFLQMTIEELKPLEDRDISFNPLTNSNLQSSTSSHYTIVHQKKNGKKINMDILSNPISYKGKNAQLAVASDITENLKYIKTIETQNEKFKEISWMQSHVVRAPLARIMGLIALLEINGEMTAESNKVLEYLLQSANELDTVIRDITLKTEVIDLEKN